MGPPQLIELAAESKESRDAWVQALSASAAAARHSEVETSADAQSVTLKGPVRKRGGRKGGVSLLWRERFMVLRGDGVAGYFASEAHFAKCTDGNRVLGAAWNQCAKGSFECRGLRVVDSSAQEDPEGFRFSLLASDTADDDDGEDIHIYIYIYIYVYCQGLSHGLAEARERADDGSKHTAALHQTVAALAEHVTSMSAELQVRV